MSGTVAEGRRVFLRHPSARDRDEFLERVRVSRKLHGRWVAAPSDDEAFAAYLLRARSADVETLFVCRNEDGAIAGVYTIGQIFYGPFCGAYLGYYAFEPFAGRGYMRDGMGSCSATRSARSGSTAWRRTSSPTTRSLALVREAASARGLLPRYLKIRADGAITSGGRSSLKTSAGDGGARPRTKNPSGYRLPTAATGHR